MEPVKPNQQTKPKPTILIIEDDPMLVKMYEAKFKNEGFNVLIGQDGESGLNLALNNRPDLIILDVMMPKMSGIEVLKKLRQTPVGKNMPVIVLSNLSKEQEAEEAASLGVKEYLIKADMTPIQVVEKVRQYL